MIIAIDDSVDVSKSVWLIVTENEITNPELSESGNGMKPNERNTGKNIHMRKTCIDILIQIPVLYI